MVFDESLFPFFEMLTSPSDLDTLSFLNDGDNSAMLAGPSAVVAGTPTGAPHSSAPGTPAPAAFSPVPPSLAPSTPPAVELDSRVGGSAPPSTPPTIESTSGLGGASDTSAYGSVAPVDDSS